MVEKLVESIVGDLTESIRGQKDLLSLSLVGSFSDPNKRLESSNDLDFVFIYNQINLEIMGRLKEVAKILKEKYSSSETEVNYTFKIGPIKLPSKKQKNLLIHFLVYSKDSYFQYESILTRYSFQHYLPLLGLPLKSINNFESVINIDIFNEIDGIPAIKSWINKKKVAYLEPKSDGFEIKESILDNDLYLEVIFYSILWLSNNILRIFGEYYPDIDKSMCERFKQRILIEMGDFPLKIYLYKKKMRSKIKISKKEADKIKSGAIKFISQCEAYLRENLSKK